MICSKCGNQIEEGTKFCTKCGAPVEEMAAAEVTAPVEETVKEEPVVEAAPVEEPVVEAAPAKEAAPAVPENEVYTAKAVPDEPKNKKSAAPIIVIIAAAILLLVAGFGAFWFTRPIQKINRAISADDTATVAANFTKLTKDADIESVQEKMLEKCEALCDQYYDEEIDYDTVMDTYELLEDDVLADNKDFAKLVEKVDAMKDSRDSWDKAEKAFADEDYETALENYEKVINDDSNYKKAQDQITACQELMTPDIVGEWEIELNMAKIILDSTGYDGDFDTSIPFPVTLVFEFDDDGTGMYYIDTDNLVDKVTPFMDMFIDVLLQQTIEESGMTEEELNEMCEDFYGMSLKEYVMEFADYDSLFDEFDSMYEYFDYEVDGKNVTVDSWDGGHDEFHFDKGQLVFDTDDDEIFGELDIELPLRLDKRD